ncbi:MAG TPA: hypothetical protein VHM90_20870, partial [Phycisphaerae bacterium]|nr:hypothetical protein [Phycisphaerae bacterium]
MQVQKFTADNRIAADRNSVALRYGPLIYCIETTDNGSVAKPIAMDAPLTAQYMPTFFEGVNNAPEGTMVIKGKFADGSDLTAIPYYARYNRRLGAAAPAAPAAADPAVAGGAAPGRGGRGGGQASVWIQSPTAAPN